MGTMFNLFPSDEFRGMCDEEDGLVLKVEYVLCEVAGGLKTTLELELVRGRRLSFVTEGMGA